MERALSHINEDLKPDAVLLTEATEPVENPWSCLGFEQDGVEARTLGFSPRLGEEQVGGR